MGRDLVGNRGGATARTRYQTMRAAQRGPMFSASLDEQLGFVELDPPGVGGGAPTLSSSSPASTSKLASPVLSDRLRRSKRNSAYLRVHFEQSDHHESDGVSTDPDAGTPGSQDRFQTPSPQRQQQAMNLKADLEPQTAFLTSSELASELQALGLKLQTQAPQQPILFVPPETHGLMNADELPGTPSRRRRF